MTPLASVAIFEKFALLKIAFCSAPASRNVSLCAASCAFPGIAGVGFSFGRTSAFMDFALSSGHELREDADWGLPSRQFHRASPGGRLLTWHFRAHARQSLSDHPDRCPRA